MAGADAAGHALAARLRLGEAQEVTWQSRPCTVLVQDDHAAGAHDGAGGGQVLVVDRRVEELLAEAAARGPAGLHRLEALAMPPPMSKMTSRSVVPNGTSIRPRAATLPTRRKSWCPFDVPCRRRRTSRAAVGTIAGQGAQGLDVVDDGRLAPETRHGGKGGRVRGMPRRPSMLAIRAVSSPQTKAPAPSLMRMSKRSRSRGCRRPGGRARASRDSASAGVDRQRVLGPDVDVAPRRAPIA